MDPRRDYRRVAMRRSIPFISLLIRFKRSTIWHLNCFHKELLSGGSTMKRILILGYICSVLVFSGFARASEKDTQVPIQKINYEEGNWVIQILGNLPNPCVTSPQPTLNQSADRPNTLILSMVGKSSGDICIQPIGGRYDVPVDLRQLVRKSRFDLQPGVTYTIRTENYPFEVSFEGPNKVAAIKGVVELTGMLMKTRLGEIGLFTNDNRLVLVDGRLVDCSSYINKQVSVVGHFGPLQTAGTRMMLPSRDQLPRLAQRLTIVEITSADR